jgi:hypothetical protein
MSSKFEMATPASKCGDQHSQVPSSRRRFLKFAVTGAALVPAASSLARPNQGQRRPPSDPRLAELLSRYGSEFGDLKRID